MLSHYTWKGNVKHPIVPVKTNSAIAPLRFAQRVKIPVAPSAERSRDTAARAASANTRRAYSSDWRIFEAWCQAHDMSALPCTEETLCAFNLARAEAGCSIRTIRRGMVSVRARQTLAGYPDPYGSYARVHWRGLRNDWHVNPVQAAPLFGVNMCRCLDILGKRRLHDLRSRAILLVGLCGGMRRSEIVALRVEDITYNDQGMVLRVAKSKTDQEGKGQRKPYTYNPDARYCPVIALRGWLLAAGITEGYIFQSIRGKRRLTGKPLAAWQVCKLVQTVTARASIVNADGLPFSGHSLRSGLMTGGTEHGASLTDAMAVSGHASDTQGRSYIRRDIMKNSMVSKLGLNGVPDA